MTVRTTLPSSGSHTGSELLDNVVQHVNRFWTLSTIPLTTIAGTGDIVTAAIDPITNVGLVAGMKFTFKAGANNTGAVTLKIGADAAKPVVTAANVALASGAILSGTTYLLHYDGTSYLVLSVPGEDTSGATLKIDTFTADGTLTKPVNFPNDGLVIIEGWAGGGGGDSNAGAGGGAYNKQTFSGSDLGATETVTIGPGGAATNPGGDTSVGTLLLAFGGGRGGSKGGGGGGQKSVGGSGNGTPDGGAPSGGLTPGSGVVGGFGNSGAGGNNERGGDGIWGGAGGGDGGKSGGDSLFGGGGGGDPGGSSVFGGDGGGNGVGGVIPGGGGGEGSAAGARGEVRVRWIS